MCPLSGRATRTLTNALNQRITVFCDDHVGDKIATQGLYEHDNLLLLLGLLELIRNPVVLDIGANIGNHSLAFATRAAVVHAFEPIPVIHALLLANVTGNGLAHVHVHRVALSDTDGTDTIFLNQSGNAGASSFDRREAEGAAVTVEKRRGDALLDALQIARVDFVKLDVEGHEAQALRGLRSTLERDKPIITMEWNDPLSVERLSGSEELQFLLTHYQVWVLGSNGDRGWWAGRPFAFLRRKFTRLFRPRKAVLYPFNPGRLYKNLLLIPHGKVGMLSAIKDLGVRS